jgi:hypothetical protein
VNPWRARLAVLAIFVAGFLCGAITLHLTRFRIQRHIMDSPAGVAGIIVHRLDRELHLTATQRRQIEASAVRAREESSRVMQPLMPQMTAVFERLRNETRAVLDEDQRHRFDRLVELRRPPFEKIWAPSSAASGTPPAQRPTPTP